jgi:hypothetical protein
MRFFNLNLTAEEVEAYCADYLEEKTARAEVARTLLRNVAVIARMQTELEELRRCQPSTSLWKLRADALVILLEIARKDYEESKAALSDEQYGFIIQASMTKLRSRAEAAVKALAAG